MRLVAALIKTKSKFITENAIYQRILEALQKCKKIREFANNLNVPIKRMFIYSSYQQVPIK